MEEKFVYHIKKKIDIDRRKKNVCDKKVTYLIWLSQKKIRKSNTISPSWCQCLTKVWICACIPNNEKLESILQEQLTNGIFNVKLSTASILNSV